MRSPDEVTECRVSRARTSSGTAAGAAASVTPAAPRTRPDRLGATTCVRGRVARERGRAEDLAAAPRDLAAAPRDLAAWMVC
eukprot:2256124-Rhodomonas_salina.1